MNRVFWAAVVLACVLVLPSAYAAQPVKVFVLHSYSQEYPWTKRQHEGFTGELARDGGHAFQISTEYLDTKRRPYDQAYAQAFATYLQQKYAGYQPDIVYVSDDNALLFAQEHLAPMFPQAPIFFSGINDADTIQRLGAARFTGVFERKEIAPNLALLRDARNRPSQIIVVGDGSNTYDAIEREVRKELRQYPEVHATYLADTSLERLLAALRRHGEGYVFLTTLGGVVDREGNVLSLDQTIHALANAGRFVILAMEDVYLTDGVLGGYVTSGRRQGAVAAQAALTYLGGVPVAQIPRVWKSPNEYMFDARVLERQHLVLPDAVQKTALLLNEPPSFYQRNRFLIVTTLVALFAALLLGALLFAVVLAHKNRRIQRHSLALAEAEENMTRAQYLARMGSWDWHIPENRLFWSDGIYAVFGITPEECEKSYEAFLALVHPADRAAVQTAVRRALDENAPYDIEHRIVRPDGAIRVLRQNAEVVRDAAGRPLRMSGTTHDVTEQKTAAEALMASEESYHGLFDSVLEAIYIQDEGGRFLDVNRGAAEMYGCTREALLDKTPGDVAAPGMNDMDLLASRFRRAFLGEPQTFEFWARRSNGECFPKEVHLTKGTYFGRDVVLAVATDITERKRMEDELRRLAHHDTLTGLPNRTVLLDRLEHRISQRRRGERMAVLFIDLDGFKHINDTLGHALGDRLLQEVAERLRGALRAEDTVGRLGGDEFVVLLEDVIDPEYAATVAQKLLQVLQGAYRVAGRDLYVSASIGLSIFPEDGATAESLLKHADAAMYMAKGAGRNAFRFYTKEITQRAMERLQLESKLRAALGGDQFLLHYQPIVDLQTRAAVGAEVLLRWQEPELGLVSPARFIPIAEEIGLIEPIGEWVLRQVCDTAKRWLDQGLIRADMTFSVNISGKQLQRSTFADRLSGILAASGLPARHLVVELTEGVLMGWQEGGAAMMSEIRQLGIGVAIDDFGTGYSSLSYLKRLPITRLKIDQSFVRDMPADQNGEAIVRAIIALGHSLQLDVVAEGIETELQASILAREGCALGQGYLYSRPLSEADFERTLLAKPCAAA